MSRLFLMRQGRGPDWDPGLGRREQAGWDAHAEFIDGLAGEGRIVLAGPVGDIDGLAVVLAVAAATEDEARALFEGDPWMGSILEIESVEPWTLWVGADRIGFPMR